MRVLNLCETARGGVGSYQRSIAGLEERGIEMHHLVPAQDMDFLGAGLRLHGFDRPRRGTRALAAMLGEFRRLMRDLDPDLCFFHSSFALAGLAALRGRRDRRPALYCPHGWAVASYPEGSAKRRLVQGVEGRLAGLADRVICVSDHERELAGALGYRGHYSLVENAVPEPRQDARYDLFADEPDALHLLFVGRLDRQKGFDILAEAMARAARPDLRLHVVGAAVRGGGPVADLPEGVRMAGWVAPDDLDSWYRSADALVVPSRWEGLPLVVPEALRNSTPALCAERSGMERLISRGVSGDHFPLEAAALAELLQGLDKAKLRAMRPAARAAYTARFSVDRMLDELEAVMREVAV